MLFISNPIKAPVALAGSLPDLLQLAKLQQLSMGANMLHGALPDTAAMPSLEVLELQGNRFHGPLPDYSKNTKLKLLLLQDNLLTGLVPSMPSMLQALLLHGNALTGSVPSFRVNSELRNITLYGNRLAGQLHLPEAGQLELFFVHNNRLSCSIAAYGTTMVGNQSGQSLALPGNQFDGPPSEQLHLSTQNVRALH